MIALLLFLIRASFDLERCGHFTRSACPASTRTGCLAGGYLAPEVFRSLEADFVGSNVAPSDPLGIQFAKGTERSTPIVSLRQHCR